MSLKEYRFLGGFLDGKVYPVDEQLDVVHMEIPSLKNNIKLMAVYRKRSYHMGFFLNITNIGYVDFFVYDGNLIIDEKNTNRVVGKNSNRFKRLKK